ncbi:MAG: Fe-S protein assembly co-chaperone HscB [Proteobacteria bacterium]|nr:Fe-S protein assembly co-chaperone HscB [Pseudomonadota bacterium]
MKNHFATFLLPEVFLVDLDALEKKYFEFQKKFHPDKSDEIEQSIAINEAYEILSNPLKRAAHILQLKDLDVENDEVAPKVDQATLLEVFEMRESGNFTAKDLSVKIKSLLGEVALNLDNQDFKAAAQILIRAKYFDKIAKDLKAKNN